MNETMKKGFAATRAILDRLILVARYHARTVSGLIPEPPDSSSEDEAWFAQNRGKIMEQDRWVREASSFRQLKDRLKKVEQDYEAVERALREAPRDTDPQ